MNSCQPGIKLPSEVVMSLDRSWVTYDIGGGTYINGIKGASILYEFQRRFSRRLRRNRIKVVDGFSNTPYKLVIDTVRLTQRKIQTTVEDERCDNPSKVWVENVLLIFHVTLFKEGVKIDEWRVSRGCSERTKECNGFLNYLLGNDDECPSFCAGRIVNFKTKPLTKRIIKDLQKKISRKIKEVAF